MRQNTTENHSLLSNTRLGQKKQSTNNTFDVEYSIVIIHNACPALNSRFPLRCNRIAKTIQKGWASGMGNHEDYGKAELGDERLSKRLPRLLDQLAGDPTASISAACQDPYQAKAAYRFVGNDEVATAAITKITREVTIEKINADKPSVLLIPQDTTEFNYNNLKAAIGMGNIGTRKTDMGIITHSAIGISDAGNVYGLLAQKTWVRPPEEHGKSSKRASLPIEEKESYKWIETIENAGASFPEDTKVIHVCDREGDIFELFCRAEEIGANYLCRRFHERNIENAVGQAKLDEYVEALPVAGTITIQVPRDSHTNRIARNAELEIKYGKCNVMSPSNLVNKSNYPKSIEVYVVSATEIDPPQGQEKILWQLITNVPTRNFEDAVTVIQWYTQRWKIETFHRTLKSGCKVEGLQSDSAEKLIKLIAIYSIIALEIMLLGYVARTHPDVTCEQWFTEEEWKILYRVANKTKEAPEKAPTIREAVRMIAKLGGFLGRRSDGDPGVTVIWRGLTKFYTILDVVEFLN
jgi:hypothetical protein